MHTLAELSYRYEFRIMWGDIIYQSYKNKLSTDQMWKIMSSKAINLWDDCMVNWTSIVSIKLIDDKKNEASDSIKSYISSLSNEWQKAIAYHRVQKYKDSVWYDLPIEKLKNWLQAFMNNMSDRPEYEKIYLQHT